MVAEEVRDGSVGRGREPGEEGGQVHLMQAGVDPRTFSPDTAGVDPRTFSPSAFFRKLTN